MNTTVGLGQTAVFSIAVNGGLPLSFQWLRNGVIIPGANGPRLTIPGVTVNDFGASFRVIVSNARGRAVSRTAILAPDSRFVRSLFAEVLGHAPAPSALSNLTLALARGVPARTVALAIVASSERRTQQVTAIYRRLFDRSPTAAQLGAGVAVLGRGTRLEVYQAALMGTPEYIARNGRTPQTVVRSVYRDVLGRNPSPTELAQGVRNFSTTTLRALALRLLDGNEARTKLVVGWHSSYLNRPPTAAELGQSLALLRSSRNQAEAAILARI